MKSFISRMFSCRMFIESIIYFLHQQIKSKYSDVKLVELLVYVVEAICRADDANLNLTISSEPLDSIDFSHSLTSGLSFQKWYEAVFIRSSDIWMYKDGSLRDRLWEKTPDGLFIVGLLGEIIKDPNGSDLKSLSTEALHMVVRPGHKEDQQVIDDLLKTDETVSSAPNQTEKAKEAMSMINSDLDAFLKMYEEDEEDEKEPEDTGESQELKSILPSFVCLLCHEGISQEDDMFPCLLCHYDSNSALRFFN